MLPRTRPRPPQSAPRAGPGLWHPIQECQGAAPAVSVWQCFLHAQPVSEVVINSVHDAARYGRELVCERAGLSPEAKKPCLWSFKAFVL